MSEERADNEGERWVETGEELEDRRECRAVEKRGKERKGEREEIARR